MATNEREKDQDSKGPVKDQRRQIATDDSDEREGPGIDCFSLSGFEWELRRIYKTAFICKIKSWETPIQENQIDSKDWKQLERGSARWHSDNVASDPILYQSLQDQEHKMQSRWNIWQRN